MMLRFLKVFGLILLAMAILAVVLYAVILLSGENETVIWIAALAVLVLSFIGIVPYLNWATKKCFRFQGEGAPIPEAELRAMLHDINRYEAPVMISERRGKLIASWNYVDAKWWEILAKAGLSKTYELHMKLDGARHLVTLIDVTKSVDWRTGPESVELRGGLMRGVVMEFEIGKRWGIKEDFQLGRIYDYRFVPQEIKTPIMNSILRSGWDVRFAMW